jgi:hypothetical protein
MDDAAENPSVPSKRNAARFLEYVFNAVETLLIEPEQVRHGQSYCRPYVSSLI